MFPRFHIVARLRSIDEKPQKMDDSFMQKISLLLVYECFMVRRVRIVRVVLRAEE